MTLQTTLCTVDYHKILSSLAENCIVIAEGELDHRGIFRVVALGMPPVESREDSMAAIKVSNSRSLSMQC